MLWYLSSLKLILEAAPKNQGNNSFTSNLASSYHEGRMSYPETNNCDAGLDPSSIMEAVSTDIQMCPIASMMSLSKLQ